MALGNKKYHWLENIANVVLVFSALTMVGLRVVDRKPRTLATEDPELVANWQAENARGIRIGPNEARVVITEFMDFECPFCRQILDPVDSIVARFPGQIAIVVHHYPLAGHKFAVPAAIASECAYRQNRFPEMFRQLFHEQESFGEKSWHEFARAAGVPDLNAFDGCMLLPRDSFPRIAYGRELGERVGVRGTPTVWINGNKIGRSDPTSIRAWTEKFVNAKPAKAVRRPRE